MSEILTLGKDTAWRRIHKLPPESYLKGIYGSAYANGSIYWINFKDPHHHILVAFDVGSEEYRVMPDIYFISLGRRCNFHLLHLEGHLAIKTNVGNHTINLWILDDDCDKNTSSRNPGNIIWTKEIIMLPLCWSTQYVRLHAVEGTDYLILELIGLRSYQVADSGKEYSTLELFGVQSYQNAVFFHSYNRKKKIFSKIEITVDGSPYSKLGAIIGYPPCKFTTYVESLLTLQRSYRPAIETPDSSSTKRIEELISQQ